jgi:hypothetical protein
MKLSFSWPVNQALKHRRNESGIIKPLTDGTLLSVSDTIWQVKGLNAEISCSEKHQYRNGQLQLQKISVFFLQLSADAQYRLPNILLQELNLQFISAVISEPVAIQQSI